MEKPYTAEDAILGAGKGLPRAGYDSNMKVEEK
jgi:hypothetical protein